MEHLSEKPKAQIYTLPTEKFKHVVSHPQLSLLHSDKKFLPSCFLLHYSLNFMNSWQVATAIPSLYRVWTLAISSGDRLTSHVLVHIAGLFLDIKAQQVLVV